MASEAGIWIDHKQAIVVSIKKNGTEVKKITSDIERSDRPARGAKNKYTKNDYVADDRRERKSAADLKSFFDQVIACISGAGALLLLGPGEAKGEFVRYAKRKKLNAKLIELETADKMTDRQIAAKVKKHFAASPAKKSTPPQKSPTTKTAKSKSVKGTSAKRPTRRVK